MASFSTRRAARILLFETAGVGSQYESGLFFWRRAGIGIWLESTGEVGAAGSLLTSEPFIKMVKLRGEGHVIEMPVK